MAEVSVIVPTHNRKRILAQSIDSILRQTGVTFELIVVDDGSSDETGPWLDRMAAVDSRIKPIHHESPRFPSNARNAGVAAASGRWVAFCDDDDLWAPNKLSMQLAALTASAARWSCTGVAIVDGALDLLGHIQVEGGEVLTRLLESNTIPTGSSVVAETEMVREVGAFDPQLRGSEDWDLWIRLAQRSPLVAVDRALIAYRLSAESASMNVERMQGGAMAVAQRYAALAAEHGAIFDEAAHEAYLAKQLLRAGEGLAAARKLTSLALKHGRWSKLPVAAAALIAPHMTDRHGWARAAARIPADWRDEAEAWLAPFRQTDRKPANPTLPEVVVDGVVAR